MLLNDTKYMNYEVTKMSQVHQLPENSMLSGKYRIVRVLGEGGFGITYEGLDTVLNLKVAIKEYYPLGLVNRTATVSTEVTAFSRENQTLFSKGKQNFLKEARTLAKFATDPSIVTVRDFFELNNTAYIVMDFLDGTDIKEFLKYNGKMSFEDTYSMLRPVMVALGKIHSEGLIHRDISPDNIMITNDGSIKLLDFGAAREISREGEKSLSVMLKPGYAPEEQYRTKGSQGPWTDIYALCATMYKMITGETPDDAMNRIFEDELENIREYNPQVSEAANAVIMKGMAVNREGRFQSMQELMRACETAIKNPASITVQNASVMSDRHSSKYLADADGIVDDRTVGFDIGKKTIGITSNDKISSDINGGDKLLEENKESIHSVKNEENSKALTRKKPNVFGAIGTVFFGMIAYLLSSFVIQSLPIDSGFRDASDNEVYVISLIIFSILTLLFAGLSHFSSKIYFPRIDIKTKKPNQVCHVISIILFVIALIVFLLFQMISIWGGSSDLKWIVILWVTLFPVFVGILFGLFYYPRLDEKKRAKKKKIYIIVLSLFATFCIFIFMLTLSNTVNISGEKFNKNDEYVSLIANSVTENDLKQLKKMKHLKQLKLDACFLDNDSLEIISEISGLEYLCIDDNGDINDISALSKLKNLKKLSLIATNVKDISPLGNLTELTELHASSNDITDISVLKNLTKIETVWINDNEITDLSALENCSNLKNLKINNINCLDKSKILLPESVENLDCYETNLTDLDFVKMCSSNLRFLNAANNNIEDISILSSCNELRTLIIHDNNIKNLEPISNCEKLEKINVCNNKLEVIPDLGCKETLAYFYITNNQVKDISGLKGCSSLKKVYLNINQIEDITPITDSYVIDTLIISDNNIRDISCLSKCTFMEMFYFKNNSISDISVLENMPQLKYVEMKKNQISDISVFKKLPNLQDDKVLHIDVSYNKISDISVFEGFGVSNLNVSHNEITDISVIRSMKNLKRVAIHYNNVSDYTPINDHPNLRFVSLSNNPISDFSDLSINPSVEAGRLFSLAISYKETYDWQTLSDIPKLDIIVVGASDAEKELLKKYGIYIFITEKELDADFTDETDDMPDDVKVATETDSTAESD